MNEREMSTENLEFLLQILCLKLKKKKKSMLQQNIEEIGQCPTYHSSCIVILP